MVKLKCEHEWMRCMIVRVRWMIVRVRWMIVRMRMNGKCESSNKNSLVIRKESKCHGVKSTNKSCWISHSRLTFVEVCSKATLHVVAIMDGITENAVTPPKLSMNNRNLEMITAVQKEKPD